jgi:hypothetical protein
MKSDLFIIGCLPAFLLSDNVYLPRHDAAIVPIAAIVLFEKSAVFGFKQTHGQIQLSTKIHAHTIGQDSWITVSHGQP